MSLKGCDTLELQDRFKDLVSQYVDITPALIEGLEKFGKVRKELQLIYVELQERNALPEVQLDSQLEDLVKKYNAQSDTTERSVLPGQDPK